MHDRPIKGSLYAKFKARFGFLGDAIERFSPRIDLWLLWDGFGIGLAGVVATLFSLSFANLFCMAVTAASDFVHTHIPFHLSVADFATYAGFGLALLTLALRWVIQRIQKGSTKT